MVSFLPLYPIAIVTAAISVRGVICMCSINSLGVVYVYVTVNCGNQSLPGMPEIFRHYWECL